MSGPYSVAAKASGSMRASTPTRRGGFHIRPERLRWPQGPAAARGLAALHMTREGLLTCGASGTPPPTAQLQRLPPWGKLSSKMTDEGEPGHCCSLTGQLRKLTPHPALRATFSLRAKSRLRRLRSDTRLRAQPLWGRLRKVALSRSRPRAGSCGQRRGRRARP